MNTHVFIVDSRTFKQHLEYLFAGTGSQENRADFIDNPAITLHGTTERMLVSMIADGGRIRCGDQIIFYLQQSLQEGIYEGKFFGIFKARDDGAFLDNNDGNQYLMDSLEKSLTFRTMIEPYKVYAEGVTEWEALDEIRHISAPHQMLWSLIYRKLKGNRGNTMLTIYEAERLTQLIRNKNQAQELICGDRALSFDQETQRIVCLDENPREYTGRQTPINILPRLIEKYHNETAFEVHLQAYITQNLGTGTNPELDQVILSGAQVEWLGNEVSCGVGMQRIDVMLSVVENGQKTLMPIELKAVEARVDNVGQIQRYVDWIQQYYIPNRPSDIQPILVTRQAERSETNNRELTRSFHDFNQANHNNGCAPLKFIEFDVTDDDELSFQITPY